VTRFLAARFRVTGVDISARQIALARRNVPSATLIHGDIMDQRFPPASFDAIVATYALFHLPRVEHGAFIGRLAEWTTAGGLALVTVAAEAEELGREDDFFGGPMVWSSHAREAYPPMFTAHRFRVLEAGDLGSGFSVAAGLPEEIHPFFLLRREAESPEKEAGAQRA
jgi:SAM-dependent methyltransferase